MVLGATLALAQTGCLKAMIADGTIGSTRKASAAFNTMHDFEVANKAAFAGLAQFEGMHMLRPENQDTIFLLTRSWAGAAFGFIEDEMERAEEEFGDDSWQYNYHRMRARAAYDRSIHYGTMLLENQHEGFKAAQVNADTMTEYLKNFEDPEDAEPLFWVGQAWMGRTNVSKEVPAVVAELYVGVALMRRSVELDETFNHASGHVILGAYHARAKMAEIPESKKHFERALELTQNKSPMAKLQLAARYHCLQGDQAAYEKLLNEVVTSEETLPGARFLSVLAKRRAKRYLGEKWLTKCGFGS